MNTSVQVFKNQYLDSTVTEITSAPVQMSGNTAVMAVLMMNISGSATPTVNFRLQGSFDGLCWVALGSGKNLTAFGPDSESATSTYAYVRVLAKVSAGTSVKALFDGFIVMSQQ